MEKIKESLNELPAFLLVSYLLLCFFRVPTLADSIIVSFLTILSGFKIYLNYNKRPTVKEQMEEQSLLFDNKFEEQKKQLELQMSKIREETQEFTRSFSTFKGLTPDDRKKESPVRKILF